MKLYNIKNLDSFLKTVDTCKGDVIVETGDPDNRKLLNLKSKLSMMVFLTLFGRKDNIDELDLQFSDQHDVGKMFNYAMGL